MGCRSRVQMIAGKGKNRKYYLICPAPLARALEIEKGEVIEWVVEDKHTLTLKRTPSRLSSSRKASHGRTSQRRPAREVAGSQ